MKAKEREEKKNLSVPELEAELRATQEKHFKLRFKHKSTPIANPAELRTLRRHMARLQTWIRQKGMASNQTGR